MQTGPKAAWRTRTAAARARLTPAERARTAAAVAEAVQSLLPLLPAGGVAAYASFGTEPGTRALLAALLRGPREVLLPVLLPDGDLDWARYAGELSRGPGSLLHPPGPPLGRGAVADCALVLVPALAVDRTGTRLGRGGGSYDRALARASGLVVAALHPGELVDALPAEPHDRPVHGALVPGDGVVRLRGHRSWPTADGPGGMAP